MSLTLCEHEFCVIFSAYLCHLYHQILWFIIDVSVIAQLLPNGHHIYHLLV